MSSTDEPIRPVHVTGDERRSPAIRKLARACLELARVQLATGQHSPAHGSDVAQQQEKPGTPASQDDARGASEEAAHE
jgi:hypothetical protein